MGIASVASASQKPGVKETAYRIANVGIWVDDGNA